MVVDLTDPNRPRFTLQELRDVLQERNKFKSQLLLVQEELQCYRRWALLPGGATPPSPALPGAPRYATCLFWCSFSRLLKDSLCAGVLAVGV